MHEIRDSILKTSIYSDIFDYPLTKDEIWRFLISDYFIERDSFEKELRNSLGAKLVHLPGGHFYCLAGRESIIKTRIRRDKNTDYKLKIAKRIAKILSVLPTIQFIGISGALSLGNSEIDDDIDLFVITSKNSLWITRLLVVCLLILMGQYRGRGKKESQKVCLNMLIDEESLVFPRERQELYTAHEIVQLKVLFDKNNIYQKFLSANKWILKFLPNGIDTKMLGYKDTKVKSLSILVSQYLNIFEFFAKHLQLWYMNMHRTSETVEDHFLAFHPFDYKEYVLREYQKRIKKHEAI